MKILYWLLFCCAIPFLVLGELSFWTAEFILMGLPEEERGWF